MNYLESAHYKFGIVVGCINLFVVICLNILEWKMGGFASDFSAGAGLAAGAICMFVLIILGIFNVIFNIVLYNLYDKKINWTSFPKDYKDLFYLYYFGFFHVLIERRLGWFIFALPLIFIWSFVANILLEIPLEFIARMLYNL